MSDGQMHVAGTRAETAVPPPACLPVYGYDEPLAGAFVYDGPANLRTCSQQRLTGIPPRTVHANIRKTGLDYFLARYYSGAQGRFTTPDPVLLSKQKLRDPQQWNLYA